MNCEAKSRDGRNTTDPDTEKYRCLLETINEAVFEIDAGGTITYINYGIHKISGHAPQEVMGRSFIGFICEEDRQRIAERFDELARGVVRSSAYRVLCKTGERRWVETFSQPRCEAGRFVGLAGVMTDIHQRKLLEEESDRHKRLLEATLNSTADGIIAADRSGRILTWNHRFEDMWVLSGARIGRLQSLAALRPAMSAQLADEHGGGGGLFDWSASRAAHTLAIKGERTFEVVSCPLSSDDPEAGLVWNFRDITAAKQTEGAFLRSGE